MKKSNVKISSTIIFATILLLASITFPDHALVAKGILKKGEDHISFDLTLTVNITKTAFNITRERFEKERELWINKWQEWKNLWEDRRQLWRQEWREWLRRWESWEDLWKEEWENKWRAQWNQTWRLEWREKWEDWEEWMEEWNIRWRKISFEEIEKIPEFIKPRFRERMRRIVEDLWNKHINALTLAECWATPASQLGLKVALGQSLNKTLQRIYNTSDVYIKNFTLALDLLTRTTLIDGEFMSTNIFNLTQSFDLYGVVVQNSSGTFIRSQFRHLNVTEKIDGRKFGYPRWIFTPCKALFMDLSVFSVPLEKWNKTFDPNTNTTIFTLVRNINVTTPFGNVIVDPELILVVPGDASGIGDIITITPILPTDLLPLRIILPTAAVATLAVAAYYLIKKRTMISKGYIGLK